MRNQLLLLLLLCFSINIYAKPELPKTFPVSYRERVERTLKSAGENRGELVRFLNEIPSGMLEGAAFLVAYMPVGDAQTLKANFLLRNTLLAFGTRAKYPWGKTIPDSVFFNDVLPYAVVDEQREEWRLFLTFRIEPLVRETKSLLEAAFAVGEGAKKTLSVRYSTSRPKTNQSPSETVMAGVATCTGLSITLVAALRSVGIPARMAGTFRWLEGKNGGNHNWVECWIDGKWYCCELAPFVGFDKGWFFKKIKPESKEFIANHIFASSYRETGNRYPLVWDGFFHSDPVWQAGLKSADASGATDIPELDRKGIRVHFLDSIKVPSLEQPHIEVNGIDVTKHYIDLIEKKYFAERQANAGKMGLSCVVVEKEVTSKEAANRIPCDIKVLDRNGQVVGEGKTLTNEHDINDHLIFYLAKGEYTIQYNGKKKQVVLNTSELVQLAY
jgi:hypothetical protein